MIRDLDSIKADLLQRLQTRVGDSRVTSELHELSGRFFAGTLAKFLLRIGLEVIALSLMIFLCDRVILSVGGGSGGETTVLVLLFRTVALLSLVYLGSYCSMRRVNESSLLHSGIFTTLVLLLWIAFGYYWSLAWMICGIIGILIVVLAFFGYSEALKR